MDQQQLKQQRRAYFDASVAVLGSAAPTPPAYAAFSHTLLDCAGAVRCAAVRLQVLRAGAKSVAPPRLYDLSVLTALNGGASALSAVLAEEPDTVNAQSISGVTLLMKACRMVAPNMPDQSRVVKLLLDHGADAMVCCDSGRNCLHDLFWGASANAAARTCGVEDVLLLLLQAIGRRRVLSLMMCPDHHGNTPLEFTGADNWRDIVDVCVSYNPFQFEGCAAPACSTVPAASAMLAKAAVGSGDSNFAPKTARATAHSPTSVAPETLLLRNASHLRRPLQQEGLTEPECRSPMYKKYRPLSTTSFVL